jgi:hypothetical protein
MLNWIKEALLMSFPEERHKVSFLFFFQALEHFAGAPIGGKEWIGFRPNCSLHILCGVHLRDMLETDWKMRGMANGFGPLPQPIGSVRPRGLSAPAHCLCRLWVMVGLSFVLPNAA